jgi:hypothetical protein
MVRMTRNRIRLPRTMKLSTLERLRKNASSSSVILVTGLSVSFSLPPVLSTGSGSTVRESGSTASGSTV